MRHSGLALLEAYEKRQQARKGVCSCAECGRELRETITGNRRLDDKFVCSDCYYEKLGEMIEQNPIVGPRALRG